MCSTLIYVFNGSKAYALKSKRCEDLWLNVRILLECIHYRFLDDIIFFKHKLRNRILIVRPTHFYKNDNTVPLSLMKDLIIPLLIKAFRAVGKVIKRIIKQKTAKYVYKLFLIANNLAFTKNRILILGITFSSFNVYHMLFNIGRYL